MLALPKCDDFSGKSRVIKPHVVGDTFVLNIGSLYFSTVSTTYSAWLPGLRVLYMPQIPAPRSECIVMLSARSEIDSRSVKKLSGACAAALRMRNYPEGINIHRACNAWWLSVAVGLRQYFLFSEAMASTLCLMAFPSCT